MGKALFEGSLQSSFASDFCPVCGDILPVATVGRTTKCGKCSTESAASAGRVVVTESAERVERPWETEVQDEADALAARATIKEDCPECGHNELSFHTAQLRSADEGQTIFFTCLKCAHKFSVNT